MNNDLAIFGRASEVPLRDPQRKKRLDMRKIRHRLARNNHILTKNGVPVLRYQKFSNGKWLGSYIYEPQYKLWERPSACVRMRRRNGSVEWQGRDGDAWGKPHVMGKSSRVAMREKSEWWAEAYTALRNAQFDGSVFA